jgi:formiminotetrahydrofolate cyclodeaminase
MGSLSAGLVTMVARLTLGRKEPPKDPARLETIVHRSEELRQRLLKLVVDDSEAFDAVMKSFKIPKDQVEMRKKAVQEATVRATEIPLSTMEQATRVLHLAAEIAEYGSTNALSDVSTASAAARAAVDGAASNVWINLGSIEDKGFVEKTQRRATELQNEAKSVDERIREIIRGR